jgi:hypothetical protein
MTAGLVMTMDRVLVGEREEKAAPYARAPASRGTKAAGKLGEREEKAVVAARGRVSAACSDERYGTSVLRVSIGAFSFLFVEREREESSCGR